MAEEFADGLDRPALVTRVIAWLNERWRHSVSAREFLRSEKPPFSIVPASAIDAAQRLSHRYDEVRMNVRNLYGAPEDEFSGVKAERFGVTGNELFNRATWAIQAEWNARFFEPEQKTARTLLKGMLAACQSTKEDASRRGNELLDKLRQTTIEPDYRRVIYGLFDEIVQYLGIFLQSEERADRHVPVWNADTSELWFRGVRVRKLRPIARDARAILASFEELGWPQRMDSPLKPDADLTRAVRTLNDKLSGLRFERDGSGEGIIWRAL